MLVRQVIRLSKETGMLELQEQISELPSEPITENAEEARVAMIRAALDEIRPYLQRDGGDCELVGVEGNVVRVKMKGACIGCQLASVTIHGIQAKLIAKLGMQLRVAPVLGFGGL
jgi:NifU-like protein